MKKLQFLTRGGAVLIAVLLCLTFIGCAQPEDSSDWWDDMFGVGPNVLKEAGTVYDQYPAPATPAANDVKWVFEGSSYKAYEYDGTAWVAQESGTYTYNTPSGMIFYTQKKEKAPTAAYLAGMVTMQTTLLGYGVEQGTIDKLQKTYTAAPDADGLIPVYQNNKPLYEFFRTHYEVFDKFDNGGTPSGLSEADFLVSVGYKGKSFSSYVTDTYLKTLPGNQDFHVEADGTPVLD